ncbi:LysR family transcriptional regulator [Aquitalea aquatica]|uniref:LysR family transcriptional regulator n=1 Tax=Aquitalea aquatica TaxID=3044273 RepID=A0A838XYF3_9NEIS|nr:LysR family transcriptional regulator [Aquitalea magnusonii]MBA4707723.1 LysR family transcriptional regulator [Aquitalea magnusonii]
MDLKRLRYFCTVVEQGNITHAARILNMAQPPLSKRLHELEDEVGVPLFFRNGRRIEPTVAGFHLYKRASEILRSVSDTVMETIALSKQETKLLRIGLSHLFQSYFSPLIMEIKRCHPDVEIGVTVSDSSHLEVLLNNGLIDIALIQKPAKNDGFDCITFAPIKVQAVISKNLLSDPEKSEIHLSELSNYPLLMLRRANGAGTFEFLQDHMRKGGVEPHIAMHVSQPGLLLEWLESGLQGAALLPSSEIKTEKLHHAKAMEIFPAPQIFFPSIVKLTTTSHMKELMDLVEQGYPFLNSHS